MLLGIFLWLSDSVSTKTDFVWGFIPDAAGLPSS